MKKIILLGLFIGISFAQQREQSNSVDYQLKEVMVMCQALEQLELKYEHQLDSLIREAWDQELKLDTLELEYFTKKKEMLKALLDLKVELIGKIEEALDSK